MAARAGSARGARRAAAPAPLAGRALPPPQGKGGAAPGGRGHGAGGGRGAAPQSRSWGRGRDCCLSTEERGASAGGAGLLRGAGPGEIRPDPTRRDATPGCSRGFAFPQARGRGHAGRGRVHQLPAQEDGAVRGDSDGYLAEVRQGDCGSAPPAVAALLGAGEGGCVRCRCTSSGGVIRCEGSFRLARGRGRRLRRRRRRRPSAVGSCQAVLLCEWRGFPCESARVTSWMDVKPGLRQRVQSDRNCVCRERS